MFYDIKLNVNRLGIFKTGSQIRPDVRKTSFRALVRGIGDGIGRIQLSKVGLGGFGKRLRIGGNVDSHWGRMKYEH